MVLRSDLHPELMGRLRAALLAIGEDAPAPPALARFGLERFVPITYEHYASEQAALRECESTLGIRPR